METMQQHINASITVNTTAQEAFEKISHVSAWWISNTDGRSENSGDIFTVSLGTTWVTFKLTEVVPDKKAVWLITDCFLPWLNVKTEWKGTEIIWEVSQVDRGVGIQFTHTLVPEVECFGQCQKAWTLYIKESLFKYINEGEGLPNKF